MPHKPVIAITLDAEPAGGYSRRPWYALAETYSNAVFNAGGIPMAVPHHVELVQEYVSLADGFIVTGGGFDIDPVLYGSSQRHETITTKPVRTAFEWALLEAAYARQKPILGICGGMQLLNVVLGGTLIQHIPDEIINGLGHKQLHAEAGHEIRICENTLLHRLAQAAGIKDSNTAVNSVHHQAVKDPGKTLRINATATDGVIEGIEDMSHPFCLGLQWHPEYYISPLDGQIFTSFIKAAAKDTSA